MQAGDINIHWVTQGEDRKIFEVRNIWVEITRNRTIQHSSESTVSRCGVLKQQLVVRTSLALAGLVVAVLVGCYVL